MTWCSTRRFIATTLVSLVTISVAPARLVYFTPTVSAKDSLFFGEVRAAGTVVIRLRGQDREDIEARTRQVAQRLQQQALGGARAEQVHAARVDSAHAVMAGTQLIVTIDSATASAAHSRPQALAQQWANNLRQTLAAPYLAVDLPARMVVPLGESHSIRYGGSYTGKLTAASSKPDLVSVVVDSSQQQLLLEGLARGTACITVHAGNVSGTFVIRCLPWAAAINHPIVAQLTSPSVPPEVARAAVFNAILANVRVEPGTSTSLGDLHRSFVGWQSSVEITGPQYLPRQETVFVGVDLVPRPEARVDQVLVSNEPERVRQPGSILRQRLAGGNGCRLLWHHVNNAGYALQFVARIVNPGPTPARVFILGSQAGPGSDEIHTGHVAMQDFWQMVVGSIGYVAVVPSGTAWEAYQRSVPPAGIVSGICEMVNLGTAPVIIEVAARRQAANLPLTTVNTADDRLKELSEFAYDGRQTAEILHEVGGAWSFVQIGKPSADPNAVQLLGHYGVLYDIAVQVENLQHKSA